MSLAAELRRKAVHVGMGGFAFALRWLTPAQAATLAAIALVFNLLALHRITRKALLRSGAEHQKGYSLGIALYPAAVLTLILVFRNRLELAAGAWALLAFGDGMAAVCGLLLGGPRLPWNPGKTWAGLAGFALYGGGMAALVIRWVQRGALESAPDVGGTTWVGSSFLATGGIDPSGGIAFLLTGCFAAAFLAAMAESLRTGIDDNLLVPLVGGVALWLAAAAEPARLFEAAPVLRSNLAAAVVVNGVLAMGALLSRGVGWSGAASGFALGVGLYTCAGWRGFLMLFAFFVLGTACTKVGYAKKAALGIAQEKGGRRGAKNAFANTTAGVLFAFLAVVTPWRDPFALAVVAAFATAASDTVASEIGQAFGRTHYLVTTFRRVPPGTDGAVSLEGTLAGVFASVVVASLAWGTGLLGPVGALIAVAAAFIGTTLESFLGATFERMSLVDNEVVNFTNTVAGGLAAIALAEILRTS